MQGSFGSTFISESLSSANDHYCTLSFVQSRLFMCVSHSVEKGLLFLFNLVEKTQPFSYSLQSFLWTLKHSYRIIFFMRACSELFAMYFV